MICNKCYGAGLRREQLDPEYYEGWNITVTYVCEECSGYGVVHCCDGMREQPEETTDVVGPK